MKEEPLTLPIIAITGSAGKTTTKEMIATIISTRWNVFKSKESLNLYTHTAAYAKHLTNRHQAAVLEFGMMVAGDIARHCSIIQPDISIITNVGTAHIGSFGGDVKTLAKAKSEIIIGMNPSGSLYVNADDPNLTYLLTDSFTGNITKIGIMQEADYQAYAIEYSTDGMIFYVNLDGISEEFKIPFFGTHQVYNALFAIAVTRQLGCNPNEIRKGLLESQKDLRNKRRMAVYQKSNNIKIIDDTWSANPHAMKAALDVLESIGEGCKIAVLASMLELGDYSEEGHKDVGRYLATKKIDLLYTFGSEAKNICEGAIERGFPFERTLHFEDKISLYKKLRQSLMPQTTVLVKGSHGLKMNEVVTYIRR